MLEVVQRQALRVLTMQKTCDRAVCGQPSVSRDATHSRRHCQVREPLLGLTSSAFGQIRHRKQLHNWKTGRNINIKLMDTCARSWNKRDATKHQLMQKTFVIHSHMPPFLRRCRLAAAVHRQCGRCSHGAGLAGSACGRRQGDG